MLGKNSCEIEAAPREMEIGKAMKYFKNNELVTVLLIKELVFCVQKTYTNEAN